MAFTADTALNNQLPLVSIKVVGRTAQLMYLMVPQHKLTKQRLIRWKRKDKAYTLNEKETKAQKLYSKVLQESVILTYHTSLHTAAITHISYILGKKKDCWLKTKWQSIHTWKAKKHVKRCVGLLIDSLPQFRITIVTYVIYYPRSTSLRNKVGQSAPGARYPHIGRGWSLSQYSSPSVISDLHILLLAQMQDANYN